MAGNVANGPDDGVAHRFEPVRAPRWAPSLAFLGAAFLVVVLTLSGAFDTDELAFARRALLWCAICGSLVAQVSVLDSLLTRMAPPGAIGRAAAGAGAIAGTVVLMTLVISALKRTPLAPDAWGHDQLLDLGLFIAPTVVTIAGFFLLLRGAAMHGRTRLKLIEARVKERLSIAAQPVIAGLLPPPRAGAKLPGWPTGEAVLWVRAQDHYLEVATSASNIFIRARMRDAIARLHAADGVQVHRSWWVAKDAVQSVRREGRDHVLILRDGPEVPVGRSRVRVLQALGWM